MRGSASGGTGPNPAESTAPRSKRNGSNCRRSGSTASPVTSSATRRPSAGASLNPWPLVPASTNTPGATSPMTGCQSGLTSYRLAQPRRPRSRRDQDARARRPAPVGGFDDDVVVARLDRGDRSAQTGLGPELQGPAEQAGGRGGRVRVPGETLPHGEAHSVQVEPGEALGEGVTIQELDLDPDLGQPAQHLADLRSMLVALKEQEAGLPEAGVVPPRDLLEAPKHPDALPGHPGQERVRVVGAADPAGAAGGAERRRLTLEHHGSNPSGRQVVGGGGPVHPCADDGDIEPVHGSIVGGDTGAMTPGPTEGLEG